MTGFSRGILSYRRYLDDKCVRHIPGVYGGCACIAGVPLWLIEAEWRQCNSVDGLLKAFPYLDAYQLNAAFKYTCEHGVEIEEDIRVNRIDRWKKPKGIVKRGYHILMWLMLELRFYSLSRKFAILAKR